MAVNLIVVAESKIERPRVVGTLVAPAPEELHRIREDGEVGHGVDRKDGEARLRSGSHYYEAEIRRPRSRPETRLLIKHGVHVFVEVAVHSGKRPIDAGAPAAFRHFDRTSARVLSFKVAVPANLRGILAWLVL